MATTTNFGWTTPNDTDLVKDGAAAIRTLGSSIDTSFVDLKGGTTGQVLAKATGTDLDYTWTNPAAGGANPNLIINGNFAINQRAYVSAANLASGSYGFDRWKSNFTNTTLTFTAAVNGQQLTINSGGGLQQIIERQLIPAGTYTLSWSGTATARVYNSGGSTPTYAASPVTVTLDGLQNVVVEFTASGGTKTLSNVKFEVGSSATAFCLAGGTIAGEQIACYRYFLQILNSSQGVGYANSTTLAPIVYTLPTPMRATPTATLSGTGWATVSSGVGATTTSSVALGVGNTAFSAAINLTVSTGLVAGQGLVGRAQNASSSLDAEL